MNQMLLFNVETVVINNRGRCVTRYSFLILLFNLLITVRKCLMDELCLDRVRYKVFLAKRHFVGSLCDSQWIIQHSPERW